MSNSHLESSPSLPSKRDKGNRVEEQVAEYLQNLGWEIKDRNVQTLNGEIDIIAADRNEIIAVEVKSVEAHSELSLEELITSHKLSHVGRLMEFWLVQEGLDRTPWRVDYVGVKVDETQSVVDLLHLRHV